VQALLQTKFIQLQRKVLHDKNIKESTFEEGDLALLYDSRFKYFKENLMIRWLGPYLVEKCNEFFFSISEPLIRNAFPYL